MDVARSVVRLGRRPKIIYRRTKDEMPALHEEVEEAAEEGVEFLFLLSPVGIHQEGKGKLRLECSQMELKGVDESGRPNPIPVKGVHRFFDAHQIIIASGEVPDLSFMTKDFTRAGKDLWTNEWGQTSVPHVFAGGDMTHTPRTIAHAIASAKKAAIAMDCLLNGLDLSQSNLIPRSMREHLGLAGHKFEFVPELARAEDLNRAYALSDERCLPRKIPIEHRMKNFKEVNEGYSYEEAIREAQRCLSCGICKMCGNCYLFCPDAAVVPSLDGEGYLFNYDYCKGAGSAKRNVPWAQS
jgi:NADPH-dependent glutamate synthase beta subunit-like oxidoreductase